MATVIPIGEPVNKTERPANACLRDPLPSSPLVMYKIQLTRHPERVWGIGGCT